MAQTCWLQLIPKQGTKWGVSNICLNVSLQQDPLYSLQQCSEIFCYPMSHRLISCNPERLQMWFSVLLKETSAGQNTETSSCSWRIPASLLHIKHGQYDDMQWWHNKCNIYSCSAIMLLFNREVPVFTVWLLLIDCLSGKVFCVWQRYQETRPRHEHDESHTHLIAVLQFSDSHQLNKLSNTRRNDWLAIILQRKKQCCFFTFLVFRNVLSSLWLLCS